MYYPPATNTTDNMKVALAVLACLAAVSANAVARQEVSAHTRFVEKQQLLMKTCLQTVTEIENRILRKALSKVTETAVGEWTGDCGGWSIAQCAASLTGSAVGFGYYQQTGSKKSYVLSRCEVMRS